MLNRLPARLGHPQAQTSQAQTSQTTAAAAVLRVGHSAGSSSVCGST
jgi:hypothetical protein